MDMKAFSASESSVMVSWKQPENSNGILKSYTVYWRDVTNAKVFIKIITVVVGIGKYSFFRN